VSNREAKTLIPIIRKHILPESIIYSDQWKSYNFPEKYQHFTVNHSKEFIDKRTGCNTNSVESIWLKCKSKIRGMCGVNRLYLQEYLDEVMWRHNECRNENKAQEATKILKTYCF
jgi:transposase